MKGKKKREVHAVCGWVEGPPVPQEKLPEHLRTLELRQKFFMKKKLEEQAKKQQP